MKNISSFLSEVRILRPKRKGIAYPMRYGIVSWNIALGMDLSIVEIIYMVNS